LHERCPGIVHFAIAPPIRRSRRLLKTPAEDKLLDAMPDRQLAAKLGRTLSSVRDRWKQYHLPIFEPEAVLEKWQRGWFQRKK
jgi:hypothetical protein